MYNTGGSAPSVSIHHFVYSIGSLKAVRKITFPTPPCIFYTLLCNNTHEPNIKWVCEWPELGGFIIRDADNTGTSLVSTVPPVSLNETTAWCDKENNLIVTHLQ